MSIDYNVCMGVGFMLDGAKVVEAMSQSDDHWNKWEDDERLTFQNNYDYAQSAVLLGILEDCSDLNDAPIIAIEEESPSMFKDMLERNQCDTAFKELFGRLPTEEEDATYGRYVFVTVS